MNAVTEIAYLSEPKARVFGFLSKLDNLPKWATEFCEGTRRDGNKFKVLTSAGELFFRIDADARTGVVDMWAGPTEDAMGLFPVRVVELPGGKVAVTFTFFQPPEMPDEVFRRQHASLRKELDGLPEVLRQHAVAAGD